MALLAQEMHLVIGGHELSVRAQAGQAVVKNALDFLFDDQAEDDMRVVVVGAFGQVVCGVAGHAFRQRSGAQSQFGTGIA